MKNQDKWSPSKFVMHNGRPSGNRDSRCFSIGSRLITDLTARLYQEHIPKPQQMCKGIARIVRPSGICLLNTPFPYLLHEAPHDYYRFTKFVSRVLLENSRFEIVNLKPSGDAPDILTDIVVKQLSRTPVLGSPTAILVQWLIWERLCRPGLVNRFLDPQRSIFR